MQKLHKAPPIQSINTIQLPEVDSYKGPKGVPIYEIVKPNCNVIKMELVFMAGRPYEHKPLVATCCAYQLREGSKELTSKKIAENIDFYGASLNIEASLDTINIQIVCLKKHFKNVVYILGSLLKEPTFPAKELKTFIRRRVENLKVDLAKNDILSYRLLTELLFGAEHPYGYNSSEYFYSSITREDLIRHYTDFLILENCYVFMAGDVAEEQRLITCDMLNSLRSGPKAELPIFEENHPKPHHDFMNKRLWVKGSQNQTSIKMGRRTFSRKDPDYPYLNFVTTLLGGYFGSRLVANIREVKGLTYGIYAMLDTQLHDGCLIISTDVSNKNVELCIKEIYKEMKSLCDAPVSHEEMTLVKNYLSGTYLNFFDGPFNSLRAIKSLVLNEIPLSDLKSLLDISQSITSDQILDISRKFLNGNDFWEVVVGTPRKNKLQ